MGPKSEFSNDLCTYFVWYKKLAIPVTPRQFWTELAAVDDPTRVVKRKLTAWIKTPAGQKALKRAVPKESLNAKSQGQDS